MARKNKRYLTKTVNLGTPENPARILAEKYIKRHGNIAFSELCRKGIIAMLSNKKEFKDFKKEQLIRERKQYRNEMKKLQKKLEENSEELEKNFDISKEDLYSL